MKALALLSGGLDSTLAIRVTLAQGVAVEAVSFFTPFCMCSRQGGCGNEARKAAGNLGVKLRVFDIGAEFIETVKSPRYGYGKNLNPCIDCRILMYVKARKHMKRVGASFVITGEVLGQRPKSQHRAALKIIEKESGLEGLVLRPLSARLLPPTVPERAGWIDRDELLAISGRSRKPQMALADQYGLVDYPCPAGGCLLTDAAFSRKMGDLMTHSDITLDDIRLLKLGRHFRLTPSAKIVVGRNEEENARLLGLAGADDITFDPADVVGPVGLGRGEFEEAGLQKAARIVARYCDGKAEDRVKLSALRMKDGKEQSIVVRPMDEEGIETLRI
jgi:tRNA U34 2-thiouridine synthase MnmA/TrmU